MARTTRTGSVKYNQAYNSFVGGQNTSAAPDNLVDIELRTAVNVDLISRGAVKVRDGAKEVEWTCMSYFTEGTPVNIDRILEYSTYDGTLIKLILANGVLLRTDSATPVKTEITTGLDYAVYANKLYMLFNNSYWVYAEGRDATTKEPTGTFTIAEVTCSEDDSILTEVKKCQYIAVRNDRIFCAGNPDGQNAVYYSQIGQPEYFKSGSHAVNAESSDGDKIMALEVFNNALLVFKANSVWAWTGYDPTSDVNFERLNTHTGTRHYRTLQLVNSHMFYLGIDGVYVIKVTYSGVLATEKVSGSIDNVFNDIHYPVGNTPGSAVAEYSRGKYYLSFCDEKNSEYSATNTANNTTVVCHVDAGEGSGSSGSNLLPWTIYKGVAFNDALQSGDDKLYFVSSVPFVLDKTQYYDFEDKAIEFEIESKSYDMNSPLHLKKFKRVWVWTNQDLVEDSVFNLVVKVDYNSTETTELDTDESLVYDIDAWANKWGWIDTVTRAVAVSKKGIRASVRIYGDSTMAAKNRVYLYGIGFMYKIKKPYK